MLSRHFPLTLTIPLLEFLANPSPKVHLPNFWLLLAFHNLSSVTPHWTFYHRMGRFSGQYRPHLRGPWEALGVSPHSKMAFCLNVGQPSLLQHLSGEWLGHHYVSTSPWSSLPSTLDILQLSLLALQKVKTVVMIQSYTWSPPPLRDLPDFPNKRDLIAELPWHFICTSFYITLILFSFVKWSVLVVEKLRNMEKIKEKHHSFPQHREIIIVNIFPCYPLSLSDD